jgi:hypothetical protein
LNNNVFESLKDKAKSQKSNNKKEAKVNNTKHNTSNNKYTITKATSNDKLRRNFYISKTTDNYLNKVSKATNRSKSELVETAIEIMKNEVEIT